MEKVVQELRMWLERKGLPTDAVEMRIVMPNAEDAHTAHNWVKRDMSPHLIADQLRKIPGDMRIYDVDVTFDYPRDKSGRR